MQMRALVFFSRVHCLIFVQGDDILKSQNRSVDYSEGDTCIGAENREGRLLPCILP